jgi:hypothetical protein
MSDYVIGIGFEQAQDLVVSVLYDDLENVYNQIKAYDDIDKLSDNDRKELKHLKKVKKALDRTIKYYSPPGEYLNPFAY